MWVLLFAFFFFKQKTAYEVRISDWSSDVCSSDLILYFPLELKDRHSYHFQNTINLKDEQRGKMGDRTGYRRDFYRCGRSGLRQRTVMKPESTDDTLRSGGRSCQRSKTANQGGNHHTRRKLSPRDRQQPNYPK